jgi:hypothetical protein
VVGSSIYWSDNFLTIQDLISYIVKDIEPFELEEVTEGTGNVITQGYPYAFEHT